MKTSIKLTALFLLASIGLFAAPAAKANIAIVPASKNVITFSSLPSERGVDVKIEKNEAGKAIVMIYDKDGNVLRKDVLSNGKGMEKAYILNQLENGDYTMEVTSNKQVVKKAIHVYEEGQTKMFIILD
ncbi:MAG TPA: hypothetical protein VIM16_04685 [Mucilaginibacter sp.]|jgi:uncharacterized protein (DUF2249 family)